MTPDPETTRRLFAEATQIIENIGSPCSMDSGGIFHYSISGIPFHSFLDGRSIVMEFLRAFKNNTLEVQLGVLDMLDIIRDPNTSQDEKNAAAETVAWSLYPWPSRKMVTPTRAAAPERKIVIQAIDIVQIGKKTWVYKWHNKVGAVVDDSASREHLGAEVDIVRDKSIADIFNGYAERHPGVPVTICHNLKDMWPQLNRQPVATLPPTETP